MDEDQDGGPRLWGVPLWLILFVTPPYGWAGLFGWAVWDAVASLWYFLTTPFRQKEEAEDEVRPRRHYHRVER